MDNGADGLSVNGSRRNSEKVVTSVLQCSEDAGREITNGGDDVDATRESDERERPVRS